MGSLDFVIPDEWKYPSNVGWIRRRSLQGPLHALQDRRSQTRVSEAHVRARIVDRAAQGVEHHRIELERILDLQAKIGSLEYRR